MRLPSPLRSVPRWLLWALALGPAPAAAQGTPPWPDAGQANAPQPGSPPSLPPAPPAPRFIAEIEQFRRADAAGPPVACPVLFVGSSSIRMWSTLVDDMTPLPVLNRGFGGAQIEDVNRYFDDVVVRYRPRAIVFYAGENDLDAGKTPDHVAAEFQRFLDMKDAALGPVPVFFTSLKPSQLRWHELAAQAEVNARVRALADRREDLVFVDVTPAMLQDGRPKPLYLPDGLHMNAEGYVLWRQVVGDSLLQAGVDRLSCAPETATTAEKTGPG